MVHSSHANKMIARARERPCEHQKQRPNSHLASCKSQTHLLCKGEREGVQLDVSIQNAHDARLHITHPWQIAASAAAHSSADLRMLWKVARGNMSASTLFHRRDQRTLLLHGRRSSISLLLGIPLLLEAALLITTLLGIPLLLRIAALLLGWVLSGCIRKEVNVRQHHRPARLSLRWSHSRIHPEAAAADRHSNPVMPC